MISSTNSCRKSMNQAHSAKGEVMPQKAIRAREVMDKGSTGPSDELEGSGNRRRLRPSGGYRKLRSYQAATVIYDGTVSFCNRFIDSRSRTHDQMVQAARSGGKNI